MQVAQGQQAGASAEPTLVSRIAAGDRSAEDEFVRAYGRGVRALVRRHCRPGETLAEDLAQDVLMRVIERLRAGAVRDAESLPAYVQATVVHTTSAEYRSRRAHEPASVLEELPSTDDPVAHLTASQTAVLVRRLIAELPVARDRQVLARFYLDEQDKDMVCRELGIDAAHFHRVVFRARERFRTLLAEANLHES